MALTLLTPHYNCVKCWAGKAQVIMPNGANFTNKAQEIILNAQNVAQEKGQQQIDALHLLYALLSQEESVVLTLLQRLGVDVEGLKRKTKSSLDKISVIVTPQRSEEHTSELQSR